MNKRDLAVRIAREQGLSEAAATRVIDQTLGAISGALAEGRPVKINNFGVFTVRGRKGHRGRNPQTGEIIEVPPSMGVHFRAGRALKEALS